MKEKNTKRHPFRGPALFFVCLLLMAAGGCAGISFYYAKADFICGTWINGIYCAGSSVEEVNRELLSEGVLDMLWLVDKDGKRYPLKVEELLASREQERDSAQEADPGGERGAYRYQFEQRLRQISDSQAPESWFMDGFREKNYTVEPEVELPELAEELLLQNLMEELPKLGLTEKAGNPAVLIHKTQDAGYELIDTKKERISVQRTADAVYSALLERRDSVELMAAGCYEDIPYTPEDEAVLLLWEKVKKFQDCKIVYRFGGELEPVDASVVCEWISRDEAGNFMLDDEEELVLDREKIKEYIDSLAEKYDTYGAVRKFQATRGDVVTIEGGTYGNKLDRKAETAYLTQAFLDGAQEVHEPQYERKAWAQGTDDIGSTYIEVDMGEQTMYYYVDGACVLQTPIVTGNMMRRRDTPAAVCYVYGKQKNRILRGPGYASHVNFWMPVRGGIGIHDARWRKEFGGEIYKTEGSHGCINTPYDAMEELYGMAEVGTPVVMFY